MRSHSAVAVMLYFLAAPIAARAADAVSMGIVPSVPAASTYIALDKGYFRDAGLDVTIETMDSVSRVIPFLATNRMQVAQGGVSAAFFNAVVQGLPIILTLEGGSTPIYHNLLVRPDLAGAIKTVADLKGRTIALSSPGSAQTYELGRTLGTANLKLRDVEVKYLPFSQMGAAFPNKAIDVALEVAPFTDRVVEEGLAKRWADPETYIRPLPMTAVGYMANSDWAAKNRDVARRLFVALARGGREYCQAYHHGPNRAEVVDIMVRHGVMNDRALLDHMDWQARTPNGAYNVASLLDIQDFYLGEGLIDGKAPAERLVDTSYAEAAAAELGPFQLANAASPLQGCR